MSRLAISVLCSFFFFTACGSSSAVPGEECQSAQECGPAGNAICVDGICRLFDEQIGFGSVVVDISFPREMINVPSSGYVRVIFPSLPDGNAISCEDVMSGGMNLEDPKLNHLQSSPKYLVFNCCGTFFPNNLIQFLRPAQGALLIVDGYENLNGEGKLKALGCVAEVDITKDEVTEDLVVSMQEQ